MHSGNCSVSDLHRNCIRTPWRVSFQKCHKAALYGYQVVALQNWHLQVAHRQNLLLLLLLLLNLRSVQSELENKALEVCNYFWWYTDPNKYSLACQGQNLELELSLFTSAHFGLLVSPKQHHQVQSCAIAKRQFHKCVLLHFCLYWLWILFWFSGWLRTVRIKTF